MPISKLVCLMFKIKRQKLFMWGKKSLLCTELCSLSLWASCQSTNQPLFSQDQNTKWNMKIPISFLSVFEINKKNTELVGRLDFYISRKDIYMCCNLRSGLHDIPKMIRTFPHGLENIHACKWISDNFPLMLTYILFLENCLKPICLHGCSQINMER